MLALILMFAQRIVIPEIVGYMTRKTAETGKVPTVEDVQAEFVRTLTEGISKGENWLATHPEQ